MLPGVTPYYLTSAAQFRPAAPPALGSAAFNTDLDEVLTRSQGRTATELALALYWDSPAGTPTPPGSGTARRRVMYPSGRWMSGRRRRCSR
jgi:hypothetical protein